MIARVILLNFSSKAIPKIFQVIERDGNVATCGFWNLHQAIVIMYSLSIVGLVIMNNRRNLAIIVLICGPVACPARRREFIVYWFDLFEKPCSFQHSMIVLLRIRSKTV